VGEDIMDEHVSMCVGTVGSKPASENSSKFLEILVKFSKASLLLYEMSKELTFENFD